MRVTHSWMASYYTSCSTLPALARMAHLSPILTTRARAYAAPAEDASPAHTHLLYSLMCTPSARGRPLQTLHLHISGRRCPRVPRPQQPMSRECVHVLAPGGCDPPQK